MALGRSTAFEYERANPQSPGGLSNLPVTFGNRMRKVFSPWRITTVDYYIYKPANLESPGGLSGLMGI